MKYPCLTLTPVIAVPDILVLLCVVHLVHLHIELAWQDVEHVLHLPPQHSQPVLITHSALDHVLLRQSLHLHQGCHGQVFLACSHSVQVVQSYPSIKSLYE